MKRTFSRSEILKAFNYAYGVSETEELAVKEWDAADVIDVVRKKLGIEGKLAIDEVD